MAVRDVDVWRDPETPGSNASGCVLIVEGQCRNQGLASTQFNSGLERPLALPEICIIGGSQVYGDRSTGTSLVGVVAFMSAKTCLPKFCMVRVGPREAHYDPVHLPTGRTLPRGRLKRTKTLPTPEPAPRVLLCPLPFAQDKDGFQRTPDYP